MGACAAISAASKDKRIKAVLAEDAWLLPYEDDLDKIISEDTPFFHAMSETYLFNQTGSDFDSREVSQRYF